MKLFTLTAAATLALTLTACDSSNPEPDAGPERFELVAAPEPETIEVTPADCLTALDSTDDLIDLFIEYTEITADAFGFAADLDLVGMDGVSKQIDDLTPRVTGVMESFYAAARECRGGAA